MGTHLAPRLGSDPRGGIDETSRAQLLLAALPLAREVEPPRSRLIPEPLGRPGLTGDDMAPRERDAEEASLKERGGAGRDLRQRDLRRGTRAAADRPRPLEFDARGIPIVQPIPSFVRRVARLLGEEHTK